MMLCCVRRHPGHLCCFTLKDVEHATPRFCHLRSHCLGVESGIVLQEWELSDVQPRALSGLEDLEDMARPIVVPSNSPGDILSNSTMACRFYTAIDHLASLPDRLTWC